MRLISPTRTFHNSGSSSRELERSAWPNEVSRWASDAWTLGRSAPYGALSIGRNLRIWNSLPSFPGRSCLNVTGEPSFHRTSTAVASSTGESTTSASADATTSRRRLIASYMRCECFIVKPIVLVGDALQGELGAHAATGRATAALSLPKVARGGIERGCERCRIVLRHDPTAVFSDSVGDAARQCADHGSCCRHRLE